MTDCFKPAPVGTMSTKVDNAQAIWATLMVQNNIPIAFADEFNKAVPVMFPDSDIVKKFRCGSTTTKKVVENIADYSIKSSLQLHSQDKWLYSISTDGGSKMLSKIYPILIYGYVNTKYRIRYISFLHSFKPKKCKLTIFWLYLFSSL